MEEPSLREVAFGSALYGLTLAFRDAELRRPLGLALSPADQAGEAAQRHFAAVLASVTGDGCSVCACVVMKPLPRDPGEDGGLGRPSRAKLRQMAVAPAWRGRGLGRWLVRFAEAAMAAEGEGRVEEVELGARASAVGFYGRLGYAIDGEPFVEVGQPHVPMRRRL